MGDAVNDGTQGRASAQKHALIPIIDKPELGEMIVAARAARDSGFSRVEIDPTHLLEVLDLARMYLELCK